jgi:hypothetical protein
MTDNVNYVAYTEYLLRLCDDNDHHIIIIIIELEL